MRDAGAISAIAIITFIAIDTMAFLSMPSEKKKNSSADFIRWVDKYMKTDVSQSYQYVGKDMWAARCGKLHGYSSTSTYALEKGCKFYAYQDGSEHIYVPEEESLVLISTHRLVIDFNKALVAFLEDMRVDSDLKNRVDQRLPNICMQFDIKN